MSTELSPGGVLTLASWNLNWSSFDPVARTTAALAHMERVFGASPEHLIVMLQEVSPESLGTILENPWVRRNFIISDTKPLKSSRTVTVDKYSRLERSAKQALDYFTTMMVAKTLPIRGCFRVPLTTKMGRDALGTDISLKSDKSASDTRECLRVCTTHLESLQEGHMLRPRQLAAISRLLKESTIHGYKVVSGIVGGDMNAIRNSEHDYHRSDDVKLTDIWEVTSRTTQSHEISRGSTDGFQSSQHRGPKRLDRFLFSGPIQPLPVNHAQEVDGSIGLFGIGLRTTVKAWEIKREELHSRGGQVIKKENKEYISEKRFETLQHLGFLSSYQVKQIEMDSWVSDHIGITVRIQVN